MEVINNVINEFIRQQKKNTEKALVEIITKYDFAVGSIELKQKLMEILPEGANIICSPYIESPTMIYAIKKFDTADLLSNEISYDQALDGMKSEYPTGKELDAFLEYKRDKKEAKNDIS